MARAGVWVCLVLLSLLGCGCAEGPRPSFEAFSRNKLAVLARNIESTRDAQLAAVEQLAKTVQTLRDQTGTGAEPDQAYQTARRLLATCETRVRASYNRIKVVKSDGLDFFHQWSKENTEYDDKDLRESSRQNRLKVRACFDAVMDQFKKTQGAMDPVVVAVNDQMLFLKHHRNTPGVPPRPEHATNPAPLLGTLQGQMNLSEIRASDFVEAAHTGGR